MGLQQLAFKSQETEMSSSFCTLRLPFSPAPRHPSCLKQDSLWFLSTFLTCPGPSPSPPGAPSTMKWPEGHSGLSPLRTCSPRKLPSRTHPDLPHLLASSDLLSHPPQLQRESLALVILRWLLSLTETPFPNPAHPPSSGWPTAPFHAVTWVHIEPKPSLSALV